MKYVASIAFLLLIALVGCGPSTPVEAGGSFQQVGTTPNCTVYTTVYNGTEIVVAESRGTSPCSVSK